MAHPKNQFPEKGHVSFLIFMYRITNVSLISNFPFPTEKYPEIKKLFGADPNFKYIVLSMVLIQFVTMYLLRNVSWPVLLSVAYCFGGVINHSLMLCKFLDLN